MGVGEEQYVRSRMMDEGMQPNADHQAVREVCKQAGMSDQADEFIERGMTPEAVHRQLFEVLAEQNRRASSGESHPVVSNRL